MENTEFVPKSSGSSKKKARAQATTEEMPQSPTGTLTLAPKFSTYSTDCTLLLPHSTMSKRLGCGARHHWLRHHRVRHHCLRHPQRLRRTRRGPPPWSPIAFATQRIFSNTNCDFVMRLYRRISILCETLELGIAESVKHEARWLGRNWSNYYTLTVVTTTAKQTLKKHRQPLDKS